MPGCDLIGAARSTLDTSRITSRSGLRAHWNSSAGPTTNKLISRFYWQIRSTRRYVITGGVGRLFGIERNEKNDDKTDKRTRLNRRFHGGHVSIMRSVALIRRQSWKSLCERAFREGTPTAAWTRGASDLFTIRCDLSAIDGRGWRTFDPRILGSRASVIVRGHCDSFDASPRWRYRLASNNVRHIVDGGREFLQFSIVAENSRLSCFNVADRGTLVCSVGDTRQRYI